MPVRKEPMVNGEVYHICTKSIAGYKIFTCDREYQRLLDAILYYSRADIPFRFSLFEKLSDKLKKEHFRANENSINIVNICAYCIMPTHIHIVTQQLIDGGISRFVNLLLKSYSKYFNVKYGRKGPLWESRFKNIPVNSDDQLLHLTRYIHLNPVKAGLVDRPEEWRFSSYKEFISQKVETRICNYYDILPIKPTIYKEFVENNQTRIDSNPD